MHIPVALSRAIHRADDVLRRRGVWRTYHLLRQTEQWPANRLRALQEEKLRKLIDHAATHSPYWARVLRQAGIDPATIRTADDLSRLPILTREIVRESGDDIRSRGIPSHHLLPNSTGGSTGSNVRFWVDRDCWRWRDAISFRQWDILGLRAGISVVQVWGSPMDAGWARSLRQSIRFFFDNRTFVSAYAIDDESLGELSRRLSREQPRVVVAYASVLDLLASRIKRGAVPWTPIPGMLVISTSETLYEEQRRNIQGVLGVRVANLYGCREFGLIALECLAGGQHVMEERFIVETIPSLDGSASRLIVTDLDNVGFPFLRYDVGDLAEMDPSLCACGRAHRKLGAILGRAFDVIRGPDGRAVGGTFWSLLLRTAVSGIDTWQVVQHSRQHLEIRTTPRGGLDVRAREIVRAEIAKALGEGIEVVFVEAERLEPLPSGKHRFVVAAPEDAVARPRTS